MITKIVQNHIKGTINRNEQQVWTEYAVNFYWQWLLKISTEEINYEKEVKILPITKKVISLIEELPFFTLFYLFIIIIDY